MRDVRQLSLRGHSLPLQFSDRVESGGYSLVITCESGRESSRRIPPVCKALVPQSAYCVSWLPLCGGPGCFLSVRKEHQTFLYPSYIRTRRGRTHLQPEPPRPPERNLEHARATKAGPRETFLFPGSLSPLGCHISIRRQRRSRSPNRSDQSEFQQHHLRTDRDLNGDGNECSVDPCDGIERYFLQSAV
jgi:hypothetical protein